MVPRAIIHRMATFAVLAAAVVAVAACSGNDAPESTPTAEVIAEVTATITPTARPPQAQTASGSEFTVTLTRQIRYIWPAAGAITSYFGDGHPTGIDIALDLNTDSPIRAVAPGTVTFAGGDPCCSLGIHVEIEHANGGRTRYGHLSSTSVAEGDLVTQGQVIGLGGDTGVSFGKHLHFELYQDGVVVDPLRFLPANQQAASGTERLTCGDAPVRLDPASLVELRFLPVNLTGYDARTAAYTGVNPYARTLGVTAEVTGPGRVLLTVPELPEALGENLDAALDVVMSKTGEPDHVIDCRLAMATRQTLANPPGTGLHDFGPIIGADGEPIGPPTATPTRTPVLGPQPVVTQSNRPEPRATSTPITRVTPQRPTLQ